MLGAAAGTTMGIGIISGTTVGRSFDIAIPMPAAPAALSNAPAINAVRRSRGFNVGRIKAGDPSMTFRVVHPQCRRYVRIDRRSSAPRVSLDTRSASFPPHRS
jgi:hypothetical protein